MSLRAHSLERPQQVAAECGLDRDSLSEGGSSTTSGSTEGTGGSRPSSPHLPYTPKHNKGCTSSTCQDSHKVSGTLADVRLRVLLCRKAWSLLIRSKMSLSLSSLTKYPRAAIVILLGILVCLLIFRPLLNDMNGAQKPIILDSSMFYNPAGQSDDRLALGMPHVLNQRGKRHHTDGQWRSFGSRFPLEAFMYSAFYDDRKSLARLPVVRIITVMEEFGKLNMFCILYYKTTNRVEYVSVIREDMGAGVQRHSKVFIEYMLTCELEHEEIPDIVGIVMNENTQTDSMIPVEIPERPALPRNFGVCISVSYWKQNPYHIIEWLELLRILGVSGVTVYNNSLEHDSSKVFLEYAREGFVDFRQSHNFMPDEGELTIHMHMSPVINDCMYRNMFKFRKIVVTDWDELIVPRNVDNYYDMLQEIDKRQIPDNGHPTKHYLFRNNYFFIDMPGVDTTQSKHLVTMQHRMKVPVSERGYAIKSIIDPLSCTTMHNHYCWRQTQLYGAGDLLIEVEPEYGVNQHYKRCHFDEWDHQDGLCKTLFSQAIQDNIMLRYKEQLYKAMKQKIEVLGLADL